MPPEAAAVTGRSASVATRVPAGAAASLLLAVALVLGGNAATIAIKASAAQWLMRSAFNAAGEDRKPWPWADFRTVARLSVPRLAIARFVLDGAHGEALAFGPGWIPASAAPGRQGNVAIAGHRDTHFAFLAELRDGDRLALALPGSAERHYRVTRRYVTDHHDLAIIDPDRADRLTLITCFPFAAVAPGGPQRFVVEAEPLRAGSDAAARRQAVTRRVQI